MEQVSIEEARRTIGEIVDRARLADQATLITRQGKPAAVVVNVESYDQMLRYTSEAAATRTSR
jgi:prevent-host-death family protein